VQLKKYDKSAAKTMTRLFGKRQMGQSAHTHS
jgi:hypothetical protein